MQRHWVVLIAVLAFIGGLWTAPVIYRWSTQEAAVDTSALQAPEGDAHPQRPLLVSLPRAGDRELPTLSQLYEQLTPSVVNISVLVAEKPPARLRWFGVDSTPRLRESRGSGVILTADGSVLTNHHVVVGAREVQVQLADGRTFPASVVGSHEATDLALLQIASDEPLSLTPAVLGRSSELSVGEWVFAIGNPYGLSHTLTTGIVSYIGRPPGDEDLLFDYIQTDTAINPGNSGGPLFNLAGEVVGINTAIYGDAEGIGFCIPIDTVRAVVPVLREDGEFHRGYLGVALAAEKFAGGGVRVARVYDGTPASEAGILEGDVLLQVGDRELSTPHALTQTVGLTPPGTEVTVTLRRGDQTLQPTVVVGDYDALMAAAEVTVPSLRIAVRAADEEDRRRARMTSDGGLTVVGVDPFGPAARSLVLGDVIVELDDAPVSDPTALNDQLQLPGRHELLVSRRGRVFPLWVR